jgi:uncharacterized protein YjhX (UPF0386 family)
MLDKDFQPANEADLIHRLYAELEEKQDRIEELEEKLGNQETEPEPEETYICVLNSCDSSFISEEGRANHLITHNFDELAEAVEDREEIVEQIKQVASDRQVKSLETKLKESDEEQEQEQEQTTEFSDEVSRIGSDLTNLQEQMIDSLGTEDFKRSRDIAEETDGEEGAIRHYYSVLKDKEVIETRQSKGARLTDKGLQVKKFLQGDVEEQEDPAMIAGYLPEIERKVITNFKRGEWISSKEVDIEGVSRDNIKNCYTSLKNKDLLQAKVGQGARLTEQGKQVKEVLTSGEVPEPEEDDDDGFRDRVEHLYDKNPDVKELSTDIRKELQEYFLEQEEQSRSIDETINKLYSNKTGDESVRNMVWRAYKQNDNIQKHPSLNGRAKKYAVNARQKKNFQGVEAVRLSENKYDEILDGFSRYERIKIALGKLFPDEGEKAEVTYQDFTSTDGGNFTGESEKEDKYAWESVYSDSVLQRALKHEFDAKDASIKLEKQGKSRDERTAAMLIVDRT